LFSLEGWKCPSRSHQASGTKGLSPQSPALPWFRCSRHSPCVPRQSRPRSDHARTLELDASSGQAVALGELLHLNVVRELGFVIHSAALQCGPRQHNMPLERRPRPPCVPVFPCFWIHVQPSQLFAVDDANRRPLKRAATVQTERICVAAPSPPRDHAWREGRSSSPHCWSR
jgi:hypothetical protein